MLKATLTAEQEQIIEDICNQQIQSLIRVSMQKRVTKYLDSLGVVMPESEIQANISEMLKKFDKLKASPGILLSIDEVCLSLFKHNLINNDKRYSGKLHKSHKSNLWKKILIKEGCKDLVMN